MARNMKRKIDKSEKKDRVELTLRKPEHWDLDAAAKMMERLIDENQEWLKEMAKR